MVEISEGAAKNLNANSKGMGTTQQENDLKTKQQKRMQRYFALNTQTKPK